MRKDEIKNIIINVLNDYFESQELEYKVNDKTVLFGNDSILDSMGLINVFVDIEAKFLDEDIEISLMSEKAMSRRNSPFRSISALSEFIQEQIGEIDE